MAQYDAASVIAGLPKAYSGTDDPSAQASQFTGQPDRVRQALTQGSSGRNYGGMQGGQYGGNMPTSFIPQNQPGWADFTALPIDQQRAQVADYMQGPNAPQLQGAQLQGWNEYQALDPAGQNAKLAAYVQQGGELPQQYQRQMPAQPMSQTNYGSYPQGGLQQYPQQGGSMSPLADYSMMPGMGTSQTPAPGSAQLPQLSPEDIAYLYSMMQGQQGGMQAGGSTLQGQQGIPQQGMNPGMYSPARMYGQQMMYGNQGMGPQQFQFQR